MTPKNIRTIIRWMAKASVPIRTDELTFFVAAHYWRYGKHNEWRTRHCYLAYIRHGTIPDFVREFVKSQIYGVILVTKVKLLEAK